MDWKKIAEARGVPETATAPLESLERAFRPLVARLAPEVDPAVTFRVAEEPE
jgi:hypothetical protein